MSTVGVVDDLSSITIYTKSTQQSSQSQSKLSYAWWGDASLTWSMADSRQFSVTNSSTPTELTYFLRNVVWPAGSNVEDIMVKFGWMTGEQFLKLDLVQITFLLIGAGAPDANQANIIVLLQQLVNDGKYGSRVCLFACVKSLKQCRPYFL